jgi:hypothetical protein
MEITHRVTKTVLFADDNKTIRETLENAVKGGTHLVGADLRGTHLVGTHLVGADLRGADLRSANFDGADLFGADLRGAHLVGANLSSADLRRANFDGADLFGADFDGADLFGAYLSGAKGLLPDGIIPLQIEGSRHWIIVREVGHITIGCEHHTVDWWEEHYAAVGRKEHYSDADVLEYRQHIAHCKEWMELNGVLTVRVAHVGGKLSKATTADRK